jgi:3-phenylpropionate/trans-cinnamate dioxygenase ferredoxin reductase component
MTTDRTMIIVGAGLAGTSAAAALRDEGFDGRVVLLGDEPREPYDHPPLSKAYLRGEAPLEDVFLHPHAYYEERGIELRTATTVESIDVAAREVRTADGGGLRYDALLLAPGSQPRRLEVPGGELRGVHYLRTLADADDLRERLQPGARLVVIGAGWIGCEVAASARQRGVDVTVLDPHAVPLERVLGSEVGGIYRDIHHDHGVRFLGESGVAALEGDESVRRVRTDAGRVLECDIVVVGIGVRPRSELAAAAGIAVDDGVLVDHHLQSTAGHVFAAGDVANAYHPFYRRRIRVEHWATALNHGPIAARGMLGHLERYDRLPYFFSDQYDVGMEYSGFAQAWDRVVFRGQPSSREFIAFWLHEERVVAGMNVNVWDVNEGIQQLISSRAAVDERLLADPDTPLADLLVAEGGRA